MCDPVEKHGWGYSYTIGYLFGDCVWTPAEYASFITGMLSIGFWLVAQFPQLILSWQLGRVDALSKTLLLAWIIGDAANIIGCYLTSQLQTQLFTAWYFFIMDALTLAQYIYYERLGLASCTPKTSASDDHDHAGLHALSPLSIHHSGILAARSGRLQASPSPGCDEDEELLLDDDRPRTRGGYRDDTYVGECYTLRTVSHENQPEETHLLKGARKPTDYASYAEFVHTTHTPSAAARGNTAAGVATASGTGSGAVSSSSASSMKSTSTNGNSLSSGNGSVDPTNPIVGFKEVSAGPSAASYDDKQITRRGGNVAMFAVFTLGVGIATLAVGGMNSLEAFAVASTSSTSTNEYYDSAANYIASNTAGNGGYSGRVLLSMDDSQMMTASETPSQVPATYSSHTKKLPSCTTELEVSFPAKVLGTIASWVSGLLYMGSRIPQIIKNKERHDRGLSVEGLSKAMFFIAVLANACYGLSIFLRSPPLDLTFWFVTMSYLVGSLGTLLLDVVVLAQTLMYATPKRTGRSHGLASRIRNQQSRETPLLSAYSTASDPEAYQAASHPLVNAANHSL